MSLTSQRARTTATTWRRHARPSVELRTVLVLELLAVAALLWICLDGVWFVVDGERWRLPLIERLHELVFPGSASLGLLVLGHVLVDRLRGLTRAWSTTERVLLVLGQLGGYGVATALAMASLVTYAPLALLPLTPLLIGLHQMNYLMMRWSRPPKA